MNIVMYKYHINSLTRLSNIILLLIFCISCHPLYSNPPEQKVNEGSTIEQHFISLIKNPQAEDILLDSFLLDKRAVKYYHPGSLNDIKIEKAQKIQFIYLHSFEIIQRDLLDERCLSEISNHFDTGPYNHLRKWDERVEVAINFNGCQFNISLMSWVEINKKYKG